MKYSQFQIELVRFSLFFLLVLTNSLLAQLISLNFSDAQPLTHGVIVKTENILWQKYVNTPKDDGLLYRYVATVLWINNVAIVPSEEFSVLTLNSCSLI